MSDRLDAVLETAAPLLKRVGEVLAAVGAPAGHEVWPALRRVRLLPWDAVQAVAALRPDDLADAGPELRLHARDYAGIAESLPPPGIWAGEAADAYEASRRRLAGHLSGDDAGLDERLATTAALADDLAAWMSRARSDLASTLAGILTSAEALSLAARAHSTTIDPAAAGEAEAAARVAVMVLDAVAETYDAAADLMAATEPLAEVRRP
ncbi:hypothetical protein AB0M54_11590 [Actinoplanes sp. NPDC051470]|uniref:hypothetical protein n=1 Tax=unclassified Actinoplanes TaxID=2626549 RepID=UPI0034444031